ncbi:hypothetical protein GCM10009716_25410 [Streptomyces sodiiphilus]|uniref:Resolvase n=1 Tax=Streptomyces sodiiphilus TaxID=226217 RepID=A0ABP5ALI9_9ACTN
MHTNQDSAPARRGPNARPDLRETARELRRAGHTYDRIVDELGVSKSSVSRWVRDLPAPAPSPKHMHRMREARWAPHRRRQTLARWNTKMAAGNEIGRLTDRELFLVGVGLYWAEGAKSKPHRLREDVHFVNSDPGMIAVYLAWLRLLGVTPDRLQYRVMIHESADVAGAERYWADEAGVHPSRLDRTTLKRHQPKTRRKNTGDSYRGCLVVRVRGGAELYRRIEGWWTGIVLGVGSGV